MIFINEWLPNPAGNDATGEWVELFNSGGSTSLTTSSAPVSLSGWVIKTSGTSKFNLKGTIGAGEYLVLKRTDTKLVLRNTDEKLFLYDAAGKLVDESGFLGSAPEGRSFSRLALRSFNEGGSSFIWSDPTPGTANRITVNNSIASNNYPTNIPLNKNLGTIEFVGLMLGAAVVLTAIVVFVLKRNEGLSKLFFGRDKEPWL